MEIQKKMSSVNVEDEAAFKMKIQKLKDVLIYINRVNSFFVRKT